MAGSQDKGKNDIASWFGKGRRKQKCRWNWQMRKGLELDETLWRLIRYSMVLAMVLNEWTDPMDWNKGLNWYWIDHLPDSTTQLMFRQLKFQLKVIELMILVSWSISWTFHEPISWSYFMNPIYLGEHCIYCTHYLHHSALIAKNYWDNSLRWASSRSPKETRTEPTR